MTDQLGNDQRQRFIFEHADIRGEVLTLESSFQQVLRHHQYPKPVQALLGEFMAAVALLSATLKFDGTITLQARGNGPLSTIVADCTNNKDLRALAQIDEAYPFAANESLSDLLKEGVLSLTIAPSDGERYQGMVPLEQDQLSHCLEDYFSRSEQLPTRLWLAVDIPNTVNGDTPRATGMLLQALPRQNQDQDSYQAQWEHITQLASTIKPEEQLRLDHQTLLFRLFHQDPVRLFTPQPLQFSCSCSQERIGQALKTLGEEELQSILAEQGNIEIDCEFCHHHYVFDHDYISRLFNVSPRVLH